jgi:hypothetical protein
MVQKRHFHILVIFILSTSAISLMNSGCRKDELNSDPSFRLSFSSDTVLFDTVFTTIGSVTKKLLVHNESNKKVVVGTVRLAGGSSSPFRINVDGVSAFEVNDLEIGANDSAYIFVKVTIDPNQQDNPLIESDSIIFETNGNQQDVKLVAWGQDAHFYNQDTLKGNVIFSDQKPHVIYGNLVVDSLCNLTIEAGARLYFHTNSGLLIRNSANVTVNGTLENPVLFRGDRLGIMYSAVAGQWLGIEFEGGSSGNKFTYADIQNAHIGIQLDSSEIKNDRSLTLYNCIIHNMNNYGILSIQSNLLALNCQVTNCGGYTVAIEGGRCEFRQCTLSNFWSSSMGAHYPTILLANNFIGEKGNLSESPLLDSYFGNCIITGNGDDEIEQDSAAGVGFHFLFENCLVKTRLNSGHQSSFPGCIVNKDAKFVDPWNGYFELDTLSVAKDAGAVSIITSSPLPIRFDLKGNDRLMDAAPDLGVYERIER